MPQRYAAISAAALAFCMEWGALARARVSDFDLKASPPLTHVRGTKRSWRDRHVPLVPELAWALDFIRPALVDKLPNVFAFDGIPEWRAIDVQRAAATAADPTIVAVGEDEHGQHSIHDWRHTHAVALLRWGYSEQIVADHEGHKNTTLVRERYGRFKPTAYDYAKPKHVAQPKKRGRAT
jgi:integrase